MTENLFSIENLQVTYPRTSNPVIDGVSLTLNQGDKVGLIGESGCGKSTLGKAAMRLLPINSCIEGEIRFKNQEISKFNNEQLRQFRGKNIGFIFQDPMTRLDPLMTIGEHCIETLMSHDRNLSRSEAKKKAIKTLEKVKIADVRWKQYPHEFSGGMRQRVAIALALLLEPQMIIADEPTTSLDVTVAAEILQELTRLCEEDNMALLLISHDLAMVGKYCDRIAVMNKGKIVEMGDSEAILYDPKHEYTQSLLKAAYSIHIKKQIEMLPKLTQPLLEVEELNQHFSLEGNILQQWFSQEKKVIKAVDDINLKLFSGEILGLVGESGCGKSTLSRTILQLIKSTSGSVKLDEEELTKLSAKKMRQKRREMQMIFQDPHASLNPLMTVGESIADPLFIHHLVKTSKEAEDKVKTLLKKVGLPENYYNSYPSDLSGGEKQRVAIARALITEPKLIICDEPVSMLDASIQSQVLELMLELKKEFHLTYLFITHDLWVARFFCDRIAVMNQGKIVETGDTEEIFSNPQNDYTKKLLKAAPLLDVGRLISWIEKTQ